jgi:hypothetical protein
MKNHWNDRGERKVREEYHLFQKLFLRSFFRRQSSSSTSFWVFFEPAFVIGGGIASRIDRVDSLPALLKTSSPSPSVGTRDNAEYISIILSIFNDFERDVDWVGFIARGWSGVRYVAGARVSAEKDLESGLGRCERGSLFCGRGSAPADDEARGKSSGEGKGEGAERATPISMVELKAFMDAGELDNCKSAPSSSKTKRNSPWGFGVEGVAVPEDRDDLLGVSIGVSWTNTNPPKRPLFSMLQSLKSTISPLALDFDDVEASSLQNGLSNEVALPEEPGALECSV